MWSDYSDRTPHINSWELFLSGYLSRVSDVIGVDTAMKMTVGVDFNGIVFDFHVSDTV